MSRSRPVGRPTLRQSKSYGREIGSSSGRKLVADRDRVYQIMRDAGIDSSVLPHPVVPETRQVGHVLLAASPAALTGDEAKTAASLEHGAGRSAERVDAERPSVKRRA